MTAPLAGLKILDLTRLLPGPLASMYLADLGAEVVKVEDPGGGDPARHYPPLKDRNSHYFLMVNRNKKSIALDLRLPADQKKFHHLVRDFDVVMESFRPGVTERLGVDYSTLHDLNPNLVYCSLTGFGHTGPLKQAPGHDLNFLSLSGILDQMAKAGEDPHPVNIQIADVAGGSLTACVAILAAIIKARAGQGGSFLDVAMLDGVMALGPMTLGAYNAKGRAPKPGTGFLSGGSPFYGVYRTKDGRHMALGAVEKKFWQNFCEAIDRTDLIEKHTLKEIPKSKIYTELKRIFRARTQKNWIRLLENVDACCTPVLTVAEAMKHPHIIDRAMIIECHRSGVRQFALPIKWSDWEFKIERPPPLLGEHQEEFDL